MAHIVSNCAPDIAICCYFDSAEQRSRLAYRAHGCSELYSLRSGSASLGPPYAAFFSPSLTGLTALFSAYTHPVSLILACALLAAGSMYVTRYGEALRIPGTWSFIPTLYFACELRREFAGQTRLAPLAL
jgi:hypothetical protein